MKSSSLPLVAVTTDVRVIEPYRWHMVPEPYITAAMSVARLQPLLVPSLGDQTDFDTILSRIDGVLATGSKSNVHPSLYGVEPHADYEPYDPDRDATSMPLIRMALERGVPLFAICRGLQELNVVLGGTLETEVQRQDDRMDHRAVESTDNDQRFQIIHDVKVKEGSCIAKAIGSGTVAVNSLHRQAIHMLGNGLQVEATAADGTVEAVSVIGSKAYAVGVQWHPEYWAECDDPSSRLFQAFGDAVRDYANGRATFTEAAE
jgi:putative glutamine amidotransferase